MDEAEGRGKEALQVYDILRSPVTPQEQATDATASSQPQQQPVNEVEATPVTRSAWKRVAVVQETLGQLDKAIGTLVAYVDTYSGDIEAWTKLACLYLTTHRYDTRIVDSRGFI